METGPIVKVAVSAAPYHIDKPYDYLVPEDLADRAVPGVRVTVPFGRGNKLNLLCQRSITLIRPI